MRKLVGRKSEINILKDALKSNRPELIVIYGRRRVGKTFLVRQVYKNDIRFEFAGIHKASLKEQLKNFHLTLTNKRTKFSEPASWIDAFHQLGQYLDKLTSVQKKVIFIDEFPWVDTRKSKFLQAFDNFWNNYASKRDDLVVVICGSAASYMVKNIISSKGGLHNRLTETISLAPFNLHETKMLLESNGLKFTNYDITQLYMVFGGIPHYLEKIRTGESVAQTIDRLCFYKNSFLRKEFDNVFASLFDQPNNYSAIIRSLATVRKGLTRMDIHKKSGVKSGGTLTKTLHELEESGFIEQYLPYQGKKESLFRLSDEYSLFYIKYIENSSPSGKGTWLTLQVKQSWKIWAGFTFETICIKHIAQIKAALKIAGIHSRQGSWISKNKTQGAQIDLLIDRDDNVINLCEMKFYSGKYTITKKYANEIMHKENSFKDDTHTRKNIFVTMITSGGLIPNQYSTQIVQNELTIDDLFLEYN